MRYNNNTILKESYNPPLPAPADGEPNIKLISRKRTREITCDIPALLPKEEYCINTATD